MFMALTQNETWEVSKHVIERYNTQEQLWVGMNSYTYTTPHTYQYNKISSKNEYTDRKFIIGYNTGIPLMYYPSDYRGFRVMNDEVNNGDNYISTNLVIMSHEKNGYIYFDTNNIVKMSYQVTKPAGLFCFNCK